MTLRPSQRQRISRWEAAKGADPPREDDRIGPVAQLLAVIAGLVLMVIVALALWMGWILWKVTATP